mmetsp:Transcript_64840/g.103160  ORF Transcript_64840/g.103160 Transcript_64840/m.103160 type:complete len:473 (-) Transcript_64840:84-1502(-)
MPHGQACKALVAGTAMAGSLAFLAPGTAPGSSVARTPSGSANTKATKAGGCAPVVLAAMGASAVGAARRQRVKTSKARTTTRAVVDDFEDVCEQTGVTLSRYCIELANRGKIDEDLNSIFNSIREAAKVIAKLVNTAPLQQAELLGLQGEINVQGEDQKKLDVITNDVFKNALRYTGKLGTLASEEEDEPVDGSVGGSEAIPLLSDEFADTGKYICVFDPLDGSSNVDAGIAVGTIFGIFKESEETNAVCNLPANIKDLDGDQVSCLAATLQPGKALVAAGYVLYSCSTELVFTLGRGVVGFTLDSSIGEYVLTRPNIEIPSRGKIYSCNEANIENWDEPFQDYIKDIQTGNCETGDKYSLRYIGSMVGDVHRTLLYGGLFAYPADTKNKDGKLRLLYEAAPMSFLLEQAGGLAITGHSRVMDIPPVSVHQRVPIILGSKEDVEECKKYYEKCDDPKLKERCANRLKGLVTA